MGHWQNARIKRTKGRSSQMSNTPTAQQGGTTSPSQQQQQGSQQQGGQQQSGQQQSGQTIFRDWASI
jgi:hypothetical protein